MMTFEAFDAVTCIVPEMFKKCMTGGTAILNAVGYLGGFDGKGSEA
jgi:hypothetical protein